MRQAGIVTEQATYPDCNNGLARGQYQQTPEAQFG